MSSENKVVCGICQDSDDDINFETRCKHHFHKKCLLTWWIDECPSCSGIISYLDNYEKIIREGTYENISELHEEEKRDLFCHSIVEGNMELFREIGKSLSSVNFCNDLNCSPLRCACFYDKYDIIYALIDEMGAEIDFKDSLGRTVLFHACSAGNLSVFERLVDLKADIHTADCCNTTLLHESARKGNHGIVTRLLELGVQVKVFDTWNNTPLMQTMIGGGWDDIARMLIDADKNVNYVNEEKNNSPISFVAILKDIEMVDRFISLGLNVNHRGEDGLTPIFHACYSGSFRAFQKLLECGAKTDVVTGKGKTVLMAACSGGNIDIVNELIKLGVDVSLKTSDRETALYFACYAKGTVEIFDRIYVELQLTPYLNRLLYIAIEHDNLAIFNRLIQLGADPECEISGITPFSYVAKFGRLRIFERFVELGAVDIYCERKGKFSFYEACSKDFLAVVDGFIDMGFPIDKTCSKGKSGIFHALENEGIKTFNGLFERGANLNLVSNNGENLLHVVCSFGNANILTRLISNSNLNKQINCQDCQGDTPLHKLCQSYNRNLDCLQVLLKNGADVDCKNNAGNTPIDLCKVPRIGQSQKFYRRLVNFKNTLI